MPLEARDIVASWTGIDTATTIRFVDGPVEHLRLPFGLNLTQRADGDFRTLVQQTKTFVAEYMSQFDPSHDYAHILRVLNLAKRIRAREQARNPSIYYDTKIVTLASLLHDYGDRKYLREGEDGSELVESFLLQHGADIELARKVQKCVSNVSYSTETKGLGDLQQTLLEIPELAIVQDADRLDAIGAIGIGRCFAFAGAKKAKDGMEGALRHFEEKLERLQGMMKTETGRELADLRTQKLKIFRGWWEEETNLAEESVKIEG